MGYYAAVVEYYIHSLKTDPSSSRLEKALKGCEALLGLILAFPKDNSDDIDIIQGVDNIRTGFKKCCALLKIDASFPESDKLSF